MRYQSKPETSKGIAIFTGTFGGILLYFAGFVATGLGAIVLFVLGLVLLIATVIAASAKYAITLDRDSRLITKAFNAVLANHESTYPVADFQSVSVDSGGRGAFGEGLVVYSAVLNGAITLRISPWTDDRNAAEAQARRISEYLDLPLR